MPGVDALSCVHGRVQTAKCWRPYSGEQCNTPKNIKLMNVTKYRMTVFFCLLKGQVNINFKNAIKCQKINGTHILTVVNPTYIMYKFEQ